jgi:hypothetical protein
MIWLMARDANAISDAAHDRHAPRVAFRVSHAGVNPLEEPTMQR